MPRIFFCIAIILACSSAYQVLGEVPQTRDQITFSFAPVVKRAMPAVVNIYTRHVEKVGVSPFMNDPLFSQLLGNNGFGGAARERVVNSLGSGVIVKADGTIVTSYHVVKGSDKINVVLYDRREFEGHVEKIDERSDLAVLKVDTKGALLPTLELRDSETLEVGDLVLAIGNPFGVGQTVTSGIISALARTAASVSDYQFFIQTDAAINPGNSGGALVDMQGRLIGINTAIYTHTGGYQGIGFAIPSDMVKAVLSEQAGKTGKVMRPWFGVSVQPVTHEIADAQGLDMPRGVLVRQVAAGSPAEQAGIKPGDIILSIGAGEVNDSQGLNFRITTTGIGNPTTANLWRGHKSVVVPVTFILPPAASETKPVTLKGNQPLNGVGVAPIDETNAEEYHLKPDQQGLVVVQVNPASEVGMNLQVGDIILGVNGKATLTVAELQKQLSVRSSRLIITIGRGGMVLTMTITH